MVPCVLLKGRRQKQVVYQSAGYVAVTQAIDVGTSSSTAQLTSLRYLHLLSRASPLAYAGNCLSHGDSPAQPKLHD
jgi:hypothetical protein